ncbi:hypothetical protein P9112_007087 [Eukaryota sp. TZLM1-RC]
MTVFSELATVFPVLEQYFIKASGAVPTRETAEKTRSKLQSLGFDASYMGDDELCSTFVHRDATDQHLVLTKHGHFDYRSNLEKYDWNKRPWTEFRDLEIAFYTYDECLSFRKTFGESGLRNPLVSYIITLLNQLGDETPFDDDLSYNDYVEFVINRSKAFGNHPRLRSYVTALQTQWVDMEVVGEPYYQFFYLIFELLYVRKDSAHVRSKVSECGEDLMSLIACTTLSQEAQNILTTFILAYFPLMGSRNNDRHTQIQTVLRKSDFCKLKGVPKVQHYRPGRYMPVKMFYGLYNSVINC